MCYLCLLDEGETVHVAGKSKIQKTSHGPSRRRGPLTWQDFGRNPAHRKGECAYALSCLPSGIKTFYPALPGIFCFGLPGIPRLVAESGNGQKNAPVCCGTSFFDFRRGPPDEDYNRFFCCVPRNDFLKLCPSRDGFFLPENPADSAFSTSGR